VTVSVKMPAGDDALVTDPDRLRRAGITNADRGEFKYFCGRLKGLSAEASTGGHSAFRSTRERSNALPSAFGCILNSASRAGGCQLSGDKHCHRRGQKDLSRSHKLTSLVRVVVEIKYSHGLSPF